MQIDREDLDNAITKGIAALIVSMNESLGPDWIDAFDGKHCSDSYRRKIEAVPLHERSLLNVVETLSEQLRDLTLTLSDEIEEREDREYYDYQRNRADRVHPAA